MLETAQERILLLRAGFTGKQIEELYIVCNNFKIVRNPVLWEKFDMNTQGSRAMCTPLYQEVAIELC